jgi:hypothetical protein
MIDVIFAGVLVSTATRLHVDRRRLRQPAAEENGRPRSGRTTSAAACVQLALLMSLLPRLGIPAAKHPECFTERHLQAPVRRPLPRPAVTVLGNGHAEYSDLPSRRASAKVATVANHETMSCEHTSRQVSSRGIDSGV